MTMAAGTLSLCPKSAIALTAVPIIDAEAGVLRNLSVVGSPYGRNPGQRQ